MKMINVLVSLILVAIPNMYCQTTHVLQPVDTVSTEAHSDTLIELPVDDSSIGAVAGLPDLSSYPSDKNYIQTRTYTNDSGTAYLDAIQYYDGLGRPIQTVQKGITPALYDLVTYQEYDGAGRESNKWLPVVLQNNNGAFVSLSTIKSNINASYPNETKPYSRPVYEASPLNRILEQYGPGQAWQNNSRSVKTDYLANIGGNDTLNCVYYKVEATSTDTLVTITNGGNYETAQLYVTRTTNEDGNASFEFKDKQGQVVLTRQIQRAGSIKTIYDTYYIYDDYGNLAAVLPPLASDGMKNGTSWTNASSAVLRNYAYLYRYDGRNRCIQKRLPGTSWSYYVYDRGDRMIFSQDGEQRAQGKWLFAIPDVFGRTVLTGVCTSTGSKAISIGAFDSNILKGVFSTTGSYNGYNLQLDGITLTLTGATVGTASYYDNYNFLQLSGFSALAYDSSAQTDYDSRYTGGYQGMLTGSYAAQALGSTASVSLCSALYYDNRNRVIQSASTNHLGGKDTECISYNFIGQPLRKKHIHTATGKTTQTEFYSYAYDHGGRLLTTKHKLNMGAEVILAENTYDELGRLKTNKKNNQANLNTTYAYNVRSWTKSSSSPLFSQTLYYNDSYGNNTPRYNGNISAMSWTTSGDKTRGYNFAYDNLSRLTAAGYLEGGVANTSYSTSYAYDKHGNITNLTRNGRTGTTTFGTIDNLNMSYAGNQLIKADDAGTNVTLSASMDFKNNSTAAKEYFYDLNGNLTKDLNKGITGITYNFLNLPQSVSIANTLGQATNTYTYAADGRKLRTVQQWSGTNSKQTDYVGNVIYESVNETTTTLRRILVDGGYIEGGAYYFYLSDHLGNNRVVANANGGIVQTNHYYPFGMLFAEGVTASGQPYKYNGKELDTERGLNLYDYSARLMDPALGRFSTMDPLAEDYYSLSPYVYCGNNPIAFIDPDGKSMESMASSFITPDGTLIEHRDDRDPRVYLVQDTYAWRKNGSKKADAEHVGYEYPGVDYASQVGQKAVYYSSKSPCLPGWLNDKPIEEDYTLESLFIPVFPFLKYLKYGGKYLWGFWDDFAKVTYKGKIYAKIGGRLYTRHAIDRMAPKALGRAAGGKTGRSVSTNIVEGVINNGYKTTRLFNGVVRTVYVLGDVHVVTEKAGKIVITVLIK